ncbi:protein isd11 [Phtheirospermum japonicum]|uniref:Protein isd11 n=1 Tax=Phtheirospermum japonicum TaxID=374723 RepID=A0A830C5K0_9LAMI|nr:protein isd11 [Phtheirospermum japonicum]
MASAPTRSEVLALFRSLIRTAREFTDYNVREYAKRRSIDAFRQNRHLSEPAEAAAAFADGKSQLAVAKRQAVVQSFYSPSVKNVMEVEHS